MRFLLVQQNFRLLLGIVVALVLSTLSLFSWIRRLPGVAVLVRRRLRHAATPVNHRSPAAEDPGRLWNQNDALPGNRADGFRYHYLLILIVATPIYLWFELSFSVNLLDKMGGDVSTDEIDAIEHWGRIISGIAVALIFLKGWLEQCEKWNRPWTVRVVVGIAITLFSIALTWQVQDTVIEFYVQRGKLEITLALGSLTVVVLLGVLVFRAWLRSSILKRRRGLVSTLGGLLLIVLAGVLMVSNLDAMLTFVTGRVGLSDKLVRDLGRERQQAATLTLVRRGLQKGIYTFDGAPVAAGAISSAEGKAALALFPIVASGIGQSRFAADRPAILRELMYRDWDEQFGGNSWSAFQDAENANAKIHAGAYRELSDAYAANVRAEGRERADAIWNEQIGELVKGGGVGPGLSLAEFQQAPAVRESVRIKLGCFDCEFRAGMRREEVTRELFKWTQANNVRQTLETLESPEHFEEGHDGERAARTYWVPIWALLFSMLGAFTHIFKMIFTSTEYIQRRTFQRAKAADSELAHAVVWNSKMVIATALFGLALFVYFSDNRVTGHENYVRLHDRMWRSQPIVGALAAHWTINAQALTYPFTRKIRPGWLVFTNDPLDWLPFRLKQDR